MSNETRRSASRRPLPNLNVLILVISLFGASVARADMSACSSAYVKESPDEQIALYTLCLTKGDMTSKDLAGAFINRGVAYLRKADADRALADFSKSIHYDPKFGLAYLNRALIYLNRGELQLAEADLTATIERYPARVRARAYSYRGVIRMSRGSCADASRDFDDALKINRKLAWDYGAKAWLLSTCADEQWRNGAEALRLAQKALSLQDHWKFHDVLAAAYAELGRYEDGVRELKLALEKIEADESASPRRASLQARLALYEAGQPYREHAGEENAEGEWLAAFL
jgi:tetratricopeptide (TPR) repeat protein